MNKTFSLMVLAVIFAIAAYSQEARFRTAEEFYMSCGQACDMPAPATVPTVATTTVNRMAVSARFGTTAAPGDDAQMVSFQTSTGEWAQRGQEFRIFMNILGKPLSGISVYGRHMKQNSNGGYDVIGYFSAEGGQSGYFDKLNPNTSVLIYTARVAPESVLGEGHSYDVTVVDAKSGVLQQQTYMYYFVGYVGQRYARNMYHVDRAYVTGGVSGQMTIVVEGSFPAQEPVLVVLGNLGGEGAAAIVPMAPMTTADSYTASILQFKMPFGGSPAMGLPVTVLLPHARLAMTYQGLVLPETRDQATNVSVTQPVTKP